MREKTKRKAVPGQVVDLASATARGMGANKHALGKVRARIIGVEKSAGTVPVEKSGLPNPSQVTGEDPFASLSAKGLTVEPPFDMLTLATLPEHNSELTQTIEAMETNIDATGHRFVPRVKITDTTPKDVSAAVQAENIRLQNFFQYATTESFVEFRMKLRKDKESTGGCYFEVLRDQTAQIIGFTHMPAYQVRLGRLEDDPILVDKKILEMQADTSVKVSDVKQWRRFRRYVQSRFISSHGFNSTVQGHKVRWFKDFGDPREYDNRTGYPIPADKLADVPQNRRANEVIFIRLYSSRTPYGVPRYIGNLLSIFGDRAAEEINYTTFRNNNIPSMAVLVSNGQLTQGTIDRIESFVESQVQGSDNYSKFLIVEGEPAGDEGEDGGQVKIEMKPLTDVQHKDALFQNYSEKNQDKIRRAFRLPPIFVGRSDDYTRSTADSSRRLADEQIFAPERLVWDELMNRVIFPEMGIIYHKYKSNTPNTTDNEQLVRILSGSEKTGGMTPRIARQMLEEILGNTLPDFPPDFPLDVPFSLTMAEAVKNKADPTQPGQQVTALKALGILANDGDADEETTVKAAEELLALNQKVEKLWRTRTQS
jgi:PBSX family phage portal protein